MRLKIRALSKLDGEAIGFAWNRCELNTKRPGRAVDSRYLPELRGDDDDECSKDWTQLLKLLLCLGIHVRRFEKELVEAEATLTKYNNDQKPQSKRLIPLTQVCLDVVC